MADRHLPDENGGEVTALLAEPMAKRAQRILICCHDFITGGTERIAIGMARHWAAAGREVRFLVGTTTGGLRDTVDPAVAVTELAPPIARSLLSRLRLGPPMVREIARLSPDIIFLPGNYQLPLCVPMGQARARGAFNAKIVFKLSNPITPHGPSAPLLRALVRRFAHHIDSVAAMNSGIARELQAIVPRADIRTLYDPVYLKPELIHPHVNAADGAVNIVWAGRFERQKDYPLALATAKILAARMPIRLTMLGTGRLHDRAIADIARLGLGEVVDAPGHVAGIDPWLDRADALLITSRYEGGPAVAVEALAHGVPIVSTDCSHFLHDIMTVPEAGRIVASRAPRALADALIAVTTAPAPDAARFAPLIAPLAPEVCARAYLAWFDEIVACGLTTGAPFATLRANPAKGG